MNDDPFDRIRPKPPGEGATPDLGEWDAGDIKTPTPRAWLLGNVFCRTFLSSLIAEGGVGKTAVRYAQLVSLAIGRSLTGEHVFERCVVLIVSLEDNADEANRRVLAVMKHHNVDPSEVRGWLFIAAPGARAGKLMTMTRLGRAERGTLAAALEAAIFRRKPAIVSLDPFVKAHGVAENDNNLIDQVAQVLVDLSAKHDIAVDVPHHVRKGPADPGNADRGRGASAARDASRLVYSLTAMTTQEAEMFGVSEQERRLYIRMDSAKVNPRPADGAGEMVQAGRRPSRQRNRPLPQRRRSPNRTSLDAAGGVRRPRHRDLQPHPRHDQKRPGGRRTFQRRQRRQDPRRLEGGKDPRAGQDRSPVQRNHQAVDQKRRSRARGLSQRERPKGPFRPSGRRDQAARN